MDVHALNYDSLDKIFQYLTIVERIRIERVCKNWRDVSLGSWRHVKTINFTNPEWSLLLKYRPNRFKHVFRMILLRCGGFVKTFKDAEVPHPLKSIIFEVLSIHCHNLEIIDALQLRITATSIANLANNCQNIKELSLGESSKITEHLLVKLLNTNPNLMHLHLYKHLIKGRCFLHVTQPITSLILERSLDKGHYPLSSLKYMDLNRLETLILSEDSQLSAEECMDFLNRFDHHSNLRKLVIQIDYGNTKNFFIPVYKFHYLQKIYLCYNDGVNDEWIKSMANTCTSLDTLRISCCENVTDNGLMELKRLTCLKNLTIEGISRIRGDSLPCLKGLMVLNCSDCISILEHNMIMVLNNCSELVLWNLNGCKNITNFFLINCAQTIKNRTNNQPLMIFVHFTSILENPNLVLPPLLLLNPDNYANNETQLAFSSINQFLV